MFYCYILFRRDIPCHLTLNTIGMSLLFKPYYVGKGCGNRVYAHKKIKNTKHHKDAITLHLLKSGYNFDDLFIKIPCDSEEFAFKLESLIIEEMGFDNLTNMNTGGKGGYHTSRLGKTYSEIYGDARAKDIIAKIVSKNKCKTASAERCLKLSIALKAYYKQPGAKAKHSQALKGRVLPRDYGKKISAKLKGKKKSPEHVEKVRAAITGKKRTYTAKFNAAYPRAKNKGTVIINGIKYDKVINMSFMRILQEQYGLLVSRKLFDKLVVSGKIKYGDLSIEFFPEGSTTIP